MFLPRLFCCYSIYIFQRFLKSQCGVSNAVAGADDTGNGSFRSYSRSDLGSFRSYSHSVRSFRPGSFRPDFRGGSFRPNFGGSFRPQFISCSFIDNKRFFLDLLIFSCDIFLFGLIRNRFRTYLSIYPSHLPTYCIERSDK